MLKDGVVNFCRDFQVTATLPKAISASFLALIPKMVHPHSLKDYRPSCLIGCLYKILTKVLASRLKQILPKVISTGQSAFLPGRQIFDGVAVVNEVVDLAKRRRDECLLFKVDFEKSYDSISWSFLEYMMGRMGFDYQWIRCICGCLSSSTMSVLVNGSPTADFRIFRGLKQGDPLSPFLFLIIGEGLVGLVQRAIQLGRFKGYEVTSGLSFSLLQFADDTMLMGKAS